MKLSHAKFDSPYCIGEVKGEDHINDNYLSAVDLARIGLMSKYSIDKYHHKGIIGVHVIGKIVFL